MLSFLFEVLALLGSVLGILTALPARLADESIMSFATWSESMFKLELCLSVNITRLPIGAGMSIRGGSFPAYRATCVVRVDAMQSGSL